MTFTLTVALGITNAQSASFVLGSALRRPFTRSGLHTRKGVIPLAENGVNEGAGEPAVTDADRGCQKSAP
jgi:hypothetical protein